MKANRYTMDAMTPHEIADLMDALERDRVRKKLAARRDENEGNETTNTREIARAMMEEEENG